MRLRVLLPIVLLSVVSVGCAARSAMAQVPTVVAPHASAVAAPAPKAPAAASKVGAPAPIQFAPTPPPLDAAPVTVEPAPLDPAAPPAPVPFDFAGLMSALSGIMAFFDPKNRNLAGQAIGIAALVRLIIWAIRTPRLPFIPNLWDKVPVNLRPFLLGALGLIAVAVEHIGMGQSVLDSVIAAAGGVFGAVGSHEVQNRVVGPPPTKPVEAPVAAAPSA